MFHEMNLILTYGRNMCILGEDFLSLSRKGCKSACKLYVILTDFLPTFEFKAY
jgi:hypothetical protein